MLKINVINRINTLGEKWSKVCWWWHCIKYTLGENGNGVGKESLNSPGLYKTL